MRKPISLLLWCALALFASCNKEEVNYRSVTDNVDPASLEKPAYQAYLPFESSAYVITKGRGLDSSKVVVGGSAKFISGQRGYAYQGDTLKSYVTIPQMTTGFLKDMSEFTLSCWVKIPKTTHKRSMDIVMADGGDSYLGTLSLTLDSLNLKASVFNKTTDSTYFVNILRSDVKAEKWAFVAMTYDQASSKLSIYIDGKLLKEEVCFTDKTSNIPMGSLILSPSMTKLYIGAFPQILSAPSTTLTYFSGSLDELRIWSKCLAKESVESLYKAEYALARNQ